MPTIAHEAPVRLMSADRKPPKFVNHTPPEEPVGPDAAAEANYEDREQSQASPERPR